MKPLNLIWQDWLIIIAIVSNQIARFLTVYAETTLKGLVSSVQAVEENPLQRALSTYNTYSFIFTLFIYALMIGMYLYERSVYMKDKTNDSHKFILDTTAVIIALLWIADMLNDLGVVAGIIFNK